MRRRILATIVAVSVLAVVGFGVPLALAVRRIQQDDSITKLEREAAAAAIEVPDLRTSPGDFTLTAPRTNDVTIAVYDLAGRRVAGAGPDRPDPAIAAALQGRLATSTGDGSISVGWPLTADERTIGAVRAALPVSSFEHRVRVAWAAMGALAGLVVAASALVAWRQAGRLARPVGALTDAVDRLGDGDFTVRVAPTGVSDLDRAGAAVEATADRLGRLVARERSFATDASHQLRTPLTGLRLTLELAAAGDGEVQEALHGALRSVDRLEATIDEMLRLVRDERPHEPVDIRPVVTDVDQAWTPALARSGRHLEVAVDEDLPAVRVAPAAVRQILEVLVGNAAVHGAGTVAISVRTTPGGVALEVADEGPGISGEDPERVFERGHGSGTGIGLALARSLAEAEGGRLTLRDPGPGPRFRLLLPAAGPAGAAQVAGISEERLSQR